jgi:drug/metabolite transporter (DMT)-like permease
VLGEQVAHAQRRAPPRAVIRPSSHYVVAVLAAALWQGMIGVFVKWIPWPPASLVAMRCAVAALALWAVLGARPPRQHATTPVGGGSLVVGGVLLAAHWGTLFWGYRIADVGPVVVAVFTHPVMTSMAEPLVYRRLPTVRQLLNALLVLAGVAYMALPAADSTSANHLSGVLMGLLSAALFAARNIHARSLMVRADPIHLMAWQTSIAALCLAPTLWWVESGLWQPHTLGLIVVLGVGFTALPHTLLVWAFTRLSASAVSVIGSLQVVSGIVLAALLLGEHPGQGVWLGAIAVMGGVGWESLVAWRQRTARLENEPRSSAAS